MRPATTAPLARSAGLRDALQASRAALAEVQDQLDVLLNLVRLQSKGAETHLETDIIDQLVGATRRADAAIVNLTKA